LNEGAGNKIYDTSDKNTDIVIFNFDEVAY